MKKIKIGAVAALVIGGLFAVQNTQADVNYTFVDDGLATDTPFDGTGVGAFDTLLDDTYPVNITLTTVDVIGQDGSLASLGTGNTMNAQGNTDALGVNSADNPGGYTSESQDFNPGEGWVFSFDVAVNLVEIDFASQGNGARMTFSSSAFTSFNLDDGKSGDIHDLGDLLVPANTAITMIMSTTGTDTSIRIADFTVAAVPEPGTLGLMGACAVGVFMIRRFRM